MTEQATYPLPQGVRGRLILPSSHYARDRRPWLRERRNGIGGSEISAIMGQNHHVSPYDVWLSKTSQDPPSDEGMPEKAFWGHKHEHNVASVMAVRNPHLGKLAPTPGLIAHEDPSLDHLRVTLDKLLVQRKTKDPRAVAGVECKTVGEPAYKNYWLDDEPPVHIQLQTQWQSGITGLEKIYVPYLVGGNELKGPWVSTADQGVIDALFEFADAWWHKHVVEMEPPETTFLDFAKMSDVWPARPPAKAIRASQELAAKIGRHLACKQRIKDAETEKDLLAYEIQREMQDAEEIHDSRGNVLTTWRRPKPSYTVDEKRLQEEEPEIYEKYLKQKRSSRTFVTKEIQT